MTEHDDNGHTPGPYEFVAGETYTIRAPDGGPIAQMKFLKGLHGVKGRRDADEVAATGRLFASAPRLRSALQRAVAILRVNEGWIGERMTPMDRADLHKDIADCEAALEESG